MLFMLIASSKFDLTLYADKYLGIFFSCKINFSEHLDYLNLQHARCTGLLFRSRRYASKKILCLLYYGIAYFLIQDGILTWGTVSNSLLQKVEIRLNSILRILINDSTYTVHLLECCTNH